MISPFYAGARYVFTGFSLIRKPGLRRFVVIPFLVNSVLFSAAIYWGFGWFENYLQQSLPDWLSWLQWLLLPILGLTLMIVVFYTFTIIANLIASPFNSVLAEKVEKNLTGKEVNQNSSLYALTTGVAKSVGAEGRKLLYLIAWSIPLLFLFLIPGLNLFAPFLWGLFGAWMMAITYVDYPMGNHEIYFPQQRKQLRANKRLALGFGGMILLMTMIPILNFIAMPVGVAGATAMWVERLSKQKIAG